MSKFKSTRRRTFHFFLLLAVLSLVLTPLLGSTPAKASKEGVYLSDSVFFSLGDIILSAGTDSQSLRFVVDLTNNSDKAVDFNAYGVRVSDADGNSYSAQLSEKTAARVQSHKVQSFKFNSTISTGLNVNDLKVVLFAWDSSEADYMRDFGTLSIGAAASEKTSTKQSIVLNVGELDASLPDDAVVSFEMLGSTKVAKDGVWTMDVDLRAENLGSTAFKLPASLVYQFVDSRGLTFTATAAAGNDSLLPQQAGKLTLQANVGGSFTDNQFSVQFVNKTTTATSVVGTLSKLNEDPFDIGQSRPYPTPNPNGVSIDVKSASFKQTADGVTVETVVSFSNNGKSIINLQALTASYQLNSNGLSVAATDSTVQPAYLSPKDTVTHTLRATLPDGADINETSLVLYEKKSGTTAVALPIISINLAKASSSGTGVSIPSDGTVINTSAGSLSVQIKQTQRLTLETDDVLLTELAVRNVSGEIVTLPALYGGFSLGDFEVTGKAVRLQSSNYINPNDVTTVYIYSKIPYTLDSSDGTIFFGEGTAQTTAGAGAGAGAAGSGSAGANTTVTPSQEWLRVAFSLNNDGIPAITKASEWNISDQGRQSVASIADSELFTLGNQKMLAVRIVQTGKEKRSGNIVPYVGYFIGPDGSIWNAKVTEETGRFCNGCVALSTLWVTLPEAVSSSVINYDLVLGEKLDDTALGNVHRYKLDNLGSAMSIPVARVGASANTDSDTISTSNAAINVGPVDLYPYSVSFNTLAAFKLATAANVNRYEVDFTYNMSKLNSVAGGNKNRSIFIELRDANDVIMKTWDIPFEGTGALINGDVKLTTDVTSLDVTHTYSPRVYVYEKFEGAVRLLGTNVTKR